MNIGFSRPYPLDSDRKSRVCSVLHSMGMTQRELAFHLGVSKVLISNVISGRQLSPSVEERIATFLGVPRVSIFPQRTLKAFQELQQRELLEKSEKERKRLERMEMREKALARSA